MDTISFFREVFHSWYFSPLIILLACAAYFVLKEPHTEGRTMSWVVLWGLFGFSLSLFLGVAIYRMTHPQVWDFTAFYLWGKAALAGLNFYQPQNLELVFNHLSLPTLDYGSFNEEVVHVGFLYPVPTILYFLPLGLMPYNTALVCWTVFNLAFALGSVAIASSTFFRGEGVKGTLLAAVLCFVCLPSISTIIFSQTNFILLFYLIMMRKYSDRPIAGLFAALALFTKPYMAVFAFALIIEKNWKGVLFMIVTVATVSLLTLAIVGTGPFVSYVLDNSIHRLPERVFSEPVNQSLHAILLRQGIISSGRPGAYIIILTIFMLLTGSFVYYLVKTRQKELIWSTLLIAALIAYPGTLTYYAVLLLFVVYQIFQEDGQFAVRPLLAALLAAAIYALVNISLFACLVFILAVLVLKATLHPSQKSIKESVST